MDNNGLNATKLTIPKPKDKILLTPFWFAHNPKAIGRIKLDVKGHIEIEKMGHYNIIYRRFIPAKKKTD